MTGSVNQIITFYSDKGGTGRSMALANIAWILASAGKRVLVLDWDLEAPGLHRYFQPFLTDPEVSTCDGILDFVTDYCLRAVQRGASGLDDDWCREQADLDPYTTSLNWPFFGDGGIDFVPAGRQAPEYSTRVNTFDWKAFYDRFRGSLLIDAMRQRLVDEYDYVLVDSRTGVSDTSGICTLQLPNSVVACFTLNNQSIQGVYAALTSIKRQRSEMNRAVRLFPLPMRIELGEVERLEMRRRYARGLLESFLPVTGADAKAYWNDTEVLSVPIYSYEETLAPFRDSGGAGSVLEAYRLFTRHLTAIDVSAERLEPSADQRRAVLAAFASLASISDGAMAAKQESLAAQAEAFYVALAPARQDEIRRALLRLVEYGDRRLSAFEVPLTDDGELSQAVSMLRDQGIVSVRIAREPGRMVVYPALELLDQWIRLRQWAEDDIVFLRWRERLRRLHRLWLDDPAVGLLKGDSWHQARGAAKRDVLVACERRPQLPFRPANRSVSDLRRGEAGGIDRSPRRGARGHDELGPHR